MMEQELVKYDIVLDGSDKIDIKQWKHQATYWAKNFEIKFIGSGR